MFKTVKKPKNSGFTIFEMVISTTIIVVMLIFVLANYRAGGNSAEFSIMLDTLLNGFSTARAKGVSGNLVANPLPPPDKIYPNNGYAIYFDEDLPNQFSIYGLNGVERMEEENLFSPDLTITDLCGLPSPAPVIVPQPCTATWDSSVASGEIIFNLAGEVTGDIKDALDVDLVGFDYFGGIITDQKTGQQAYFYVSLLTGIANGDIL